MKTAQCEVRNHRWDKLDQDSRGIPGVSKCQDCDHVCGNRPRRKVAAAAQAAPPTSPQSARPDGYIPPGPAQPRPINETLRKKWGLGAHPGNLAGEAQAADPSAAAASAPEEEPQRKGTVNVGRLLKDNAPGLLISGPEFVLERFGRIPKPVDSDLEADLKECTDQLLEKKFPKMEVDPFWGAIIILGMITVQMGWGSQRKEEPAERPALPPRQPDPRPADTKTSAHATTGTSQIPQSLPSSSQAPILSLVPDGGGGVVTTAEPAAPVE